MNSLQQCASRSFVFFCNFVLMMLIASSAHGKPHWPNWNPPAQTCTPAPTPTPKPVTVPNSGNALTDLKAILPLIKSNASNPTGVTTLTDAAVQRFGVVETGIGTLNTQISTQSAQITTQSGQITAQAKQIADLQAQISALKPGSLDTAGLSYCPEMGEFTQPVNVPCVNQAGFVFKRVTVAGFGEAWQLPSGQIWSDILAVRKTKAEAAAVCSTVGGRLPTLDDVKDGVKSQYWWILPFMQYGDMWNKYPSNAVPATFWTSTACPSLAGYSVTYRASSGNRLADELAAVTNPVCYKDTETQENANVVLAVRCIKK